jgi:hypothetical protein
MLNDEVIPFTRVSSVVRISIKKVGKRLSGDDRKSVMVCHKSYTFLTNATNHPVAASNPAF